MNKLLLKTIFFIGIMISPTVAGVINATMYKNLNCGCCTFYGKYLQAHNINLNVIADDNKVAEIKNKHLIKGDLASCHTVEIGGYVVEGHVPYQAITKLLNENPNIKGIGIGGMPTFSPGMAEPQNGQVSKLNVYALQNDGAVKNFGVFEYKGHKVFE